MKLFRFKTLAAAAAAALLTVPALADVNVGVTISLTGPPRNSSRNLSRPNATCWRSWNSSSTKSGTSPDDASSSRPFG